MRGFGAAPVTSAGDDEQGKRSWGLRAAQVEIARRMLSGEGFVKVEAEVIDASTLSQAEKAALWLYGWSFVDWRNQRREALAHIELLAKTTAAPVQLHDAVSER